MAQVTVKVGLDSVTRNFENATINEVINDPVVQAMGTPDNVEAKIDGQIVDLHSSVRDGDIITLSQKASSKA